MRIKRKIVSIVFVTVLALTLFIFPATSFAADKAPEATVSISSTDLVPPSSDISDDLNYSEDFSTQLLTRTTVSGGCSITRNSSTSVTIAGYSISSSYDPALRVSLSLQAYYNGSWHTLATKVKTVSGTRVNLSQTYTVTSGYYYRVKGYHALADGTSCRTCTSGIWVG